MSGKNFILKLYSQVDSQVWFANVKMLLANQIGGFLNFNISKTIGVIKWICLSVCTHLLRLHTDDAILVGHGQASPKRLLKL